MSTVKSKTKRLARKLGILSKAKSRPFNSYKYQKYKYLCIIDFESTCWREKKAGQSPEIIEFPSVLLNVETGAIESEFHHYVQPQEKPVLSEFCKELTGITQDQVDRGVPIGVCLRLFHQWVTTLEENSGVIFVRPETTETDCSSEKTWDGKDSLVAMATWSDWDLGVCLKYECQRKSIRKHSYFSQWMDIRAIYRNFYNRKPNGLHGALDDLGMRFEGRQHSGIDDARNTVRLCHRLVCDGCVLKITKVLPAKANRIYAVECSRSGVLTSRSGVTTNRNGVLTNRNGITTNRSGVTTSNLSSLARAASTSVLTCPLIVEQRGAISSQDWEKDYPSLPSNEQRVAKKDNGSSEDDISPSTSGEMQQDGDTMNSSLTSSQDQLFLDSIALRLEVPDTSQSHSNPANSNVFKKPTTIPSKREPTTPLSNFPLSKAPNTPVLKEIQMTHSPQVFGLTTPKPLDVCQFVPTPKQPCHSNEKKSTLSLSFSTPDAKCHVGGDGHVTPAGRSSFKLTPPMCKCGKRTREKTVYKEGPNKGKQFFSCTKRNGCNYFMWRSDLVSSTSPQLFTEYDF